MRLDTSLNLRMEQRQILAPRMIQSMEILQLPIMALEERIRQELDENPALEIKEPTLDEIKDEPGTAEEVETDDGREPDGELIIDEDNQLDFNRLDALEQDLGDSYNEEHRPSRNGIDAESDRKHDAMSNMPSRPQSLQDYLAEQLGFVDVPEEELDVVRYLISHIDSRGYLSYKVPEGADMLEELAKNCPFPIGRDDVEDALKMLQKLDPPGVGARNVGECLLLQVDADTPYYDVVRTLIENHLEDIGHNRLPVIQKKTGLEIPVIKKAIEVIHGLNPKPGAQFDSDSIPYVTPDIIVDRNEAGDFDVRLVDDWIPNIHIPRSAIELARTKGDDPKAREFIRRKIQAAQWLMDAIEQRRGTLEKVTRAIIKHQKSFLDKGPEFIEPLKMQQIADDVGVHVTTVSRAVDDKWVQTPRGIFPLKRFFGGGTQTTTGEEVAWETIKNKLLELIGNEDKANPLSDEDIVDRLGQSGYPVARRTVTKYRKMLNIPSSRQRKDWALA